MGSADGAYFVSKFRRQYADLKRGFTNFFQTVRLWVIDSSGDALLKESIGFQSNIDQIVNEQAPAHLRSINYVVAGMLVTLVFISAIMRVDVIVVGYGRLITQTAPISLQPLDRAVLRELRVKPGDVVQAGQILATLDSTFARADMDSLIAQKRSLAAQLKRLEAESTDSAFEANVAADQEEQLQQTLYVQRRGQYESRLQIYDQDIKRLESSIKSAERDQASLSKQLELARGISAMRASLLETQNGSKLQYLESESNRLRVEQSFDDSANRAVELRHDYQSKLSERQNFIGDWHRQILENLAATRIEIEKLNESLAKATHLNDLIVMAAPADGVVLEVAKHTAGSVIREAEPLITIVPTDAKLVAEVQINSGDVGYTKAGDEVVIKVDAFPFTRHGLLKGRLISVTEESYTPGSSPNFTSGPSGRSSSFHRARIELLDGKLENIPEGAHLIAGMTLVADIKTGTRSVISFFLGPLTEVLGESVREP
jgi:HlyD family secretion protein